MQRRINGTLWLGLAMAAALLTANLMADHQQAGGQAQTNQAQNQNKTQPENATERGQSGFRGGSQAQNANDFAQQGNSTSKPTPWLGVILQEAQPNQKGVRVARIYPSGPAARAGLYPGDELLQIDDKQVDSVDGAVKVIESDKPDQKIDLVVLRNGERKTLTATLADRRDFLAEPPQQNQGGNASDDAFLNVPGHHMMLEQHRHFAQQHQRIEQKLDQVLKELDQLKKQLGQKQGRTGASQ